MEARKRQLYELITDRNIVYKIPVYQRSYAWEDKQIKQLFNDVEKLIKKPDSKHFLGTIVYKEEVTSSLVKTRMIIDGQQRMTSVILFLLAIRDLEKETEFAEYLYAQIDDCIYNMHEKKTDNYLRLKLVKLDQDAFVKLLEGEETDSKIYENYKTIKTAIKKSSYDVRNFFNAIRQLEIVSISLDEEDNAQIIFESLNSTGLDLETSDLIRNFILMDLDYDLQVNLHENYWLKIEQELGISNLSEFIRHFLILKNGNRVTKKDVYDQFKKYYFAAALSSEEILRSLYKYSKYYGVILKSNSNDEEIDRRLLVLNEMKSTAPYPFLMDAFDKFYSEEISKVDLIKVLELINSFIYRRDVCNVPTNSLNTVLSTMTKSVYEIMQDGISYLDACVDYLMSKTSNSRFPRDKEFRAAFIKNNFKTKEAKDTLYLIEKSNHKEVVPKDDLQLEHIMPQTLSPAWRLELGDKAIEIHETWKDTIGNLTLTNYNQEMSNDVFEQKVDFYKDSNIKVTRDLASYSKWDAEQIEKRAEELFKYIEKIFYLPEDNYKDTSPDELIVNQEYSISDSSISVTGRKPAAVIILGEEFEVKSWKDVLRVVSRALYGLDSKQFESLCENKLFSGRVEREGTIGLQDFRNPEKISDDIYIETNYSANNILSFASLLASQYELEDEIFFTIR